MDSIACLIALICATMALQVRSLVTVTGLYGDTLVIPCNNGAAPSEKLMFTKWKYEKDDSTYGDLMVKKAETGERTGQPTGEYATRVTIADNSSLLISRATLRDQRTFTCMMVSDDNLLEYPVTVLIHKKPSSPQIMDKANELDEDTLEMLGTCVVKDANPAAELIWAKNGQPLRDDGKAVIISASVKVDPATGLSSTSSTLQYTATKVDAAARFTCLSAHQLLATQQESAPETFTIRYPTERLTLLVLSKGIIREGDNVTLKCVADGNPPPSSFNFHIKGKKVVVNSDSYTLPTVTRNSAGEYKCSLVGDEKILASQNIDVTYLDLNVSPTGKIVKTVGDSLVVKTEKNSSGVARVSWTKDGKAIEAPRFGQITYADTGIYTCKASVAGITRSQSFELLVEGTAVITRLTKQRGEDGQHKVLTCEAEGVPEPIFQWSVNGTQEEGSYIKGKATQRLTVVPKANLTVTCTVSNKLGEDVKTINISSLFKEETKGEKAAQEDGGDQAKLIVGIVVGLIIAAAVVGLAYWIYMKKSRQGSWKTGEKEVGTCEEEKTLEENNHKQEA